MTREKLVSGLRKAGRTGIRYAPAAAMVLLPFLAHAQEAAATITIVYF